MKKIEFEAIMEQYEAINTGSKLIIDGKTTSNIYQYKTIYLYFYDEKCYIKGDMPNLLKRLILFEGDSVYRQEDYYVATNIPGLINFFFKYEKVMESPNVLISRPNKDLSKNFFNVEASVAKKLKINRPTSEILKDFEMTERYKESREKILGLTDGKKFLDKLDTFDKSINFFIDKENIGEIIKDAYLKYPKFMININSDSGCNFKIEGKLIEIIYSVDEERFSYTIKYRKSDSEYIVVSHFFEYITKYMHGEIIKIERYGIEPYTIAYNITRDLFFINDKRVKDYPNYLKALNIELKEAIIRANKVTGFSKKSKTRVK